MVANSAQRHSLALEDKSWPGQHRDKEIGLTDQVSPEFEKEETHDIDWPSQAMAGIWVWRTSSGR
jgi:hypothetical protein